MCISEMTAQSLPTRQLQMCHALCNATILMACSYVADHIELCSWISTEDITKHKLL